MIEHSHRQALQILDSWIPDPDGGLPYECFLFMALRRNS